MPAPFHISFCDEFMKSLPDSAESISLCVILCSIASAFAETTSLSPVDRGRYIVRTSGCNDCHTAGYMPALGKIAESEWLKGDSVGWQGPWGTTCAINLRLFVSRLTEEQWLSVEKTAEARPPMPWWALHDMDDQDLRAIYSFIRSLPVDGEEAPAYLGPGITRETPCFTSYANPGRGMEGK